VRLSQPYREVIALDYARRRPAPRRRLADDTRAAKSEDLPSTCGGRVLDPPLLRFSRLETRRRMV
jgi:hypothetical protein